MVKCAECEEHVEQGNKCNVLKAALSFPPASEVICPNFKPKKEPQPEVSKSGAK